MKNSIFFLIALISLTSCSSYVDSLNAYRNSPEGQREQQRRYVLDSIRASRTIYNTPYNVLYRHYPRPYYNTPIYVRTNRRTGRIVVRSKPVRRQPVRRNPTRNRGRRN